MDRARLLRVLLLAYAVVIFIGSSIPGLTTPGPGFILKDKFAHMGEYFVLGVLLFAAIGWQVSRSRVVTFGFLFAVAISVGGLDEIYQSFIPGREMSIYDWYADAIGAALGIGIFVFTALGRRWPGPAGQPVARRGA